MATIEVKYFGLIAEKLGRESESMRIELSENLELKRFFENRYSALQGMPFQVAVNQEIRDMIGADEDINEIALLPPFAGG